MSPPGKRERRSPTETGAHNITATTTAAAVSVPRGTVSRPHGTPFCQWRHFDKNRRRREHAELKSLLRCDFPPPSTFSLEPDELRRHANTLVADYGWTVAEVLVVLDVQLRATP